MTGEVGPTGNSELSPDLHEAYQALRVEFWDLFSRKEDFVEETEIEDGGGLVSRPLDLRHKDYELYIQLLDYSSTDFEHLMVNGLIYVWINDAEYEFGLDRKSLTIWRKSPIDLAKHGISDRDYEHEDYNEMVDRRENAHKNIELERLFSEPDIATLKEVRDMAEWLRNSEVIKV